jgi:hypothetical protein
MKVGQVVVMISPSSIPVRRFAGEITRRQLGRSSPSNPIVERDQRLRTEA